jgi:hypothetical protein
MAPRTDSRLTRGLVEEGAETRRGLLWSWYSGESSARVVWWRSERLGLSCRSLVRERGRRCDTTVQDSLSESGFPGCAEEGWETGREADREG